MTTILADANWGVMVADSQCTDGDRVWLTKKVRRINGALVGCAGSAEEGEWFFDWFARGMPEEKLNFRNSQALVLSEFGLFFFPASCVPERMHNGVDAVGSGAKAAMCAHEAMGFVDPKKAVQIVCKHDAGSRGPVRVHKLYP